MQWVTGRAGCTNLMQWAVAGEGDPSVVFLGAVLIAAMVRSRRCRRYRHRICDYGTGGCRGYSWVWSEADAGLVYMFPRRWMTWPGCSGLSITPTQRKCSP